MKNTGGDLFSTKKAKARVTNYKTYNSDVELNSSNDSYYNPQNKILPLSVSGKQFTAGLDLLTSIKGSKMA